MYHSGANVPNKASTPITSSRPQLQAYDSGDSAYSKSQRSQPQTYNSSTIPSQNQYSSGSYQSQPQSFRPHSPTGSNYSVNSSTIHSRSKYDDILK